MTEVEFKDKNGGVNRCYETRIKVVIDDKTYYMQTPVMNGSNPVKDNSMNQNRVWTSMCRAFVKCVAINTGLGFGLWLNEELEQTKVKKFENEIPIEDRPADDTQIKCIKHYGEVYSLNLDMWLKSNGTNWDKLTELEAGKMLRALNEKYGALDYAEKDRQSK
jgi:hypothetical protein